VIDNIKDLRKRYDGVVWTGFIGLGLGPVVGSYEHGNETLGSVKYWEVIELLPV
jgi:hypothetical protein